MDYYEANLDAIKYRSDHFYELLLSQPTQKELDFKDDREATNKTIATINKGGCKTWHATHFLSYSNGMRIDLMYELVGQS